MACDKHGPECEPTWEEYYPRFELAMRERFRQGHEEYGDRVFSRDPQELLIEMLQEAEDIMGWGFILRYRLAHLLKHVQGDWQPFQRTSELLSSARKQNDRLTAENRRLRELVREHNHNVAQECYEIEVKEGQ
jgi:hypothetical protein